MSHFLPFYSLLSACLWLCKRRPMFISLVLFFYLRLFISVFYHFRLIAIDGHLIDDRPTSMGGDLALGLGGTKNFVEANFIMNDLLLPKLSIFSTQNS